MRMRAARLVATLTLAVVGMFASAAPALAIPGPWIIYATYEGGREAVVRCERQGQILTHYYPEKYADYNCVLDAPRHYRLWMQLEIPY
jgi:hypothetical protein